jgi:glycosyltransferase involved in cell wall biosynthesis
MTQLGSHWTKKGHQVKILCAFEGLGLPPRETVNGFEVVRAGNFYSALPTLIRLYITHYGDWADVVLETILSYPLYVPLYSRQPTSVLVLHLMGRAWFQVLPFPKALFGYVTERSIPFLYRKARVVTISEGTRQDLLALGIQEDEIILAPCGVDTERYVPGQQSSEPMVCFVGRLDDRRKRVEDLIEAFPYIEREVPGTRLILAGPGTRTREAILRERAQPYPSMEIVGYLEEDEKIMLYQRSWVGAFPSVKEGFPLTVLESSACGTPVVTYEHPGLSTVIEGETGLVVHEGEPQALAEAIVTLLKDPGRRLEMGRKGRDHARQFSWQRMADTVLGVLSQEGLGV